LDVPLAGALQGRSISQLK